MEFNVRSWTFGVICVFPGVWCESCRLLPYFYLYAIFSQRKAARKPLLLAPFVTEACCGLNNFLEGCCCVTQWFWHDWFMLSCLNLCVWLSCFIALLLISQAHIFAAVPDNRFLCDSCWLVGIWGSEAGYFYLLWCPSIVKTKQKYVRELSDCFLLYVIV